MQVVCLKLNGQTLGAVHILRNTKIGHFCPPPHVTDLVKILINLYK